MSSTLVDYSQSGEQDIILRWAGTKVGRFLDIGAGIATEFSNTHALFHLGWTGVCVEPSPYLFDDLLKTYAETGVECVNAAITSESYGLLRFHYSRGDYLSSLDASQRERWPDVGFESYWAAAIPLSYVLDKFGAFEFVSIDTEGTSIELLESYRCHESWKRLQCVSVEIEGRDDIHRVNEVCRGWIKKKTPNNLVLWR